MTYKQQAPPFSLHLEPVEGCSLACSFCALQVLRDSGADWRTGAHGTNSVPYRFADVDLFDFIGAQAVKLNWLRPRIELAGHGEPTMHAQLPQIIGVLRKHLPQAYMLLTTNGSGLLKPGRIEALFTAGLDTLAFDMYKQAKWNDDVRTALHSYAADALVPTFIYPDMNGGNPHRRHKGPRIVYIRDISENTTGTHKITNQGGNSGARQVLDQRCAKPFRDLFIRWDGNVAICCDDWRGQYKIGNVRTLGLLATWQHARFDAARRMLWRGKRGAIEVCSGCNVRTYRNGLLPDKYGKEQMPAITTETQELIKQAQRGKVFSIKLARGD